MLGNDPKEEERCEVAIPSFLFGLTACVEVILDRYMQGEYQTCRDSITLLYFTSRAA